MALDLSRFQDRFRQETREQLGRINGSLEELVQVAKSSGGTVPLDSVVELLRTVHSIKGAARMMGCRMIDRVCHQMEELLSAIRIRESSSDEALGALLRASEVVDKLLGMEPLAADAGDNPPDWVQECLADLQNCITADAAFAAGAVLTPAAAVPAPKTQPTDDRRKMPPEPAGLSSIRVEVSALDSLLQTVRELNRVAGGLKSAQGELEQLEELVDEALGLGGDNPAAKPLTTLRRRLATLAKSLPERAGRVADWARTIERCSTEMRMRPLEDLFHLLPAQVAALAESVGKRVRLDLAGGDIHLDGRIVERLNEPLIHILRNSVDHGIETPEQRQRLGKQPDGWIWMGALENAGWIRLTIADDGCGIDLRKIWQRAADLNLTPVREPPKNAAAARQGYQFLFDDRFTSRRTATSLSGRGVGLAAVKRRVQELQGDIAVESEPGLMTRFILTIPASLSSSRQMIVTLNDGDRCRMWLAIPLTMVQGIKRRAAGRHDDDDGYNGAGSQDIPSLSLPAMLSGLRNSPTDANLGYELVLSDGVRSVRTAVSDLVAEAELVVEPLPLLLQPVPLIAGVAVWSEARILPVLNVPAILNQAYVELTDELST